MRPVLTGARFWANPPRSLTERRNTQFDDQKSSKTLEKSTLLQ